MNTPHPGQWRLARIEVVNWGTFSGHHVVPVPREGFLLTGHSGSGKSSLVDAVAAVLTPPEQLRFNVAAAGTGATEREAGDRDVVSYARGAWRHRTDESTGEAVADHLRPGATWSGVLLRYSNGTDAPDGVVTLVRLFHLTRGSSTPAMLHVVVPGEAGLLDFERYVRSGPDVAGVTSAWPDATVSERHGPFAAAFTQALGIGSEQALVLLHRTQSAKNLGSLDDLFRGHMLDEPSTFELAARAVDQFADVARAYADIETSRRQIEHLSRLATLTKAYDEGSAAGVRAATLRGSLETFKDAWKLDLAHGALADARAAEDRAQHHRQAADTEVDVAANTHQQAVNVLGARGGQALATQADRLQRAGEIAALVRTRRGELATDLGSVGMNMPETFAEFAALKEKARWESAARSRWPPGRSRRSRARWPPSRRVRRRRSRRAPCRRWPRVRSRRSPRVRSRRSRRAPSPPWGGPGRPRHSTRASGRRWRRAPPSGTGTRPSPRGSRPSGRPRRTCRPSSRRPGGPWRRPRAWTSPRCRSRPSCCVSGRRTPSGAPPSRRSCTRWPRSCSWRRRTGPPSRAPWRPGRACVTAWSACATTRPGPRTPIRSCTRSR
ncbi:ATP-binding protein [Promicromonospora soli]